MLLPFQIQNWLLLVLALILGLTIDMFIDTYGMNTVATLLIAYLRPRVLKLLSSREGYELGASPKLQTLGIDWFLKYCIIMVSIHHFTLFYIEAFRSDLFFLTLAKAIASSLLTIILIIIIQLLSFKTKPK